MSEKRIEMEPQQDATAILCSLLENKDIKRAKNYWEWADKCMLVIQIKLFLKR